MDPQIGKGVGITSVPLKTLEKVGLLKKTANIFLYKKSERIMAAVFAVSDAISSDTLRERCRLEALNLFGGVRDAIGTRGSVSAAEGGRLSLGALSLAALLEVACRLGELSEGNYSLLRGELAKVAEALSQAQSDAEATIDRRILEDGLPAQAGEPARRAVAPRPRAGARGDAEAVVRAPHPAENVADRPISAPVAGVSFKGSVSEVMLALSDSIKDREDSVLDIVRKNGQVSIKDVLQRMPEVGEKTVQRTLSALVARGVLRKVGERRWSRYEVLQSGLGV